MGGRLTEMFDFLNREPIFSPTERKLIYCSFDVGEEEKSARRKIRKERKNEEKTPAK